MLSDEPIETLISDEHIETVTAIRATAENECAQDQSEQVRASSGNILGRNFYGTMVLWYYDTMIR